MAGKQQRFEAPYGPNAPDYRNARAVDKTYPFWVSKRDEAVHALISQTATDVEPFVQEDPSSQIVFATLTAREMQQRKHARQRVAHVRRKETYDDW